MVLIFIQRNYQNQISLKEIAQAVELSPSYLTDLVRRETGKTVLAWIKEYRMAKARQLLLKTDRSIEQISEAVGYLDRRHFNRQFLQVHQLTPQAWRETKRDYASILYVETRYGVSNLTAEQALQLQACLKKLGDILESDTVMSQSLMWDTKKNCIVLINNNLVNLIFALDEVEPD